MDTWQIQAFGNVTCGAELQFRCPQCPRSPVPVERKARSVTPWFYTNTPLRGTIWSRAEVRAWSWFKKRRWQNTTAHLWTPLRAFLLQTEKTLSALQNKHADATVTTLTLIHVVHGGIVWHWLIRLWENRRIGGNLRPSSTSGDWCKLCCCDLQTDDALGDHAQAAQSGRVVRQTFAIDREVLVKRRHGEGVHNLQHQTEIRTRFLLWVWAFTCAPAHTWIFSSLSVWLADTMSAFSPLSFLCRVLLLIPPNWGTLAASAALPSLNFCRLAPSSD